MSRSQPSVQDTTTVFNRIWYERAMKDNVSKQTNVNGYVDTGWSENIKQSPANLYGSIQAPSPVLSIKSEYGEFKCNQRSAPDGNYQDYNSLPRSTNSYSPLRPVPHFDVRSASNVVLNQFGAPVQVLPESAYGLVNHQRHYNEVENVYSEVSEHIYNQPMQEVLRPHRPAPPSPLVLGYPQSMQQLQRKLGHVPQTQVKNF